MGICVTPEAGSSSPPATCTCRCTSRVPVCVRSLTVTPPVYSPCSRRRSRVHSHLSTSMLPLDPFDLLWYSSVRTGTLMVPVRPDAACFVARPRVLPRGLRVHVLIRLPVTRSLARCSCLPARDERRDSLACTPTLLALLANSARTPGERLPCHLHLTVIYTLLSHRTVLACAFLPRSAMLTRPCRCPCFQWTHWASLFTPVRASERPLYSFVLHSFACPWPCPRSALAAPRPRETCAPHFAAALALLVAARPARDERRDSLACTRLTL